MSDGQRQPEDRQSDQWEACSPGELTQLVHRLDARQRWARRKQVLNTALVSTAVFACVVLALGTFMDRGGTHYGGIPCSVCRTHLTNYQLHMTGQLAEDGSELRGDLLASVKTHLEKCTFCRGKYNAMYPDTPLANTATQPVVAFARQPLFAVADTVVRY